MTTITTRCPHCLSMNRLPIDRINESPSCGGCKLKLLQDAPIEGTPANLDALIKGEKPVVIDFWAAWCTPCTNFDPVYYEVAKDHQSVIFVKVDTVEHQALCATHNIRSIPTLLVYKAGKVVDKLDGPLPKVEFEAWLAQALEK